MMTRTELEAALTRLGLDVPEKERAELADAAHYITEMVARLRLRGRGMPNPRGAAGDLYAEVKIVVPAQPSDRERDLWQRLAQACGFDPRGARSGAKGGR